MKIIFIKVNGKIQSFKVMEELLKKTFRFTKVNLLTIKETVLVLKFILILICIWESLNKMKKKDLVFTCFKKVVIIMVFFNKVNVMDLELYMIKIFLLFIMVFGKMI